MLIGFCARISMGYEMMKKISYPRNPVNVAMTVKTEYVVLQLVSTSKLEVSSCDDCIHAVVASSLCCLLLGIEYYLLIWK